MQIITLASGSTGNCTLLTDGDTSVLIDAGISAKRICTALSQFGIAPEQLSGILITHEHSDHINGLKILLKHHDIPVFAPRTVANHLRWSIAGVEDYIAELPCGCTSRVGGLSVVPFHTPHDTPESVGYRFIGSSTFGFCTDCGHVTEDVLDGLEGADSVIIEANHDLDMLKLGSYPVSLKRRILSDFGHLSNDCCGELAVKLYDSGTRKIILGHLSRENNTPSLALDTVCSAFSQVGIIPGRDIIIDVAPEKEIFDFSSGVHAYAGN